MMGLMTKKILFFSFVFLMILAGLVRLDRFFFKKNESFSLRHILIAHPELIPSYSIPSCPPELFTKTYSYLSKGKQSFVFESSDHQYVLKIYHFPSMLRKFPWMNHPKDFFFHFNEYYEQDVEKFQKCMASIKNCTLDLKDQCGLLGVHFGDSLDAQKIHLIDKLDQNYFLPGHELIFMIQKKAVLFFTALEDTLHSQNIDQTKQLISGIVQLFRDCYVKGYEDRDSIIDKNYGVSEGRVIIIDTGQILPLVSTLSLKEYLIKKTDSVKAKLERDCPGLLEYYWSEIEKNS